MTFMFVHPANSGWTKRQRTNDGETEVVVAAGQGGQGGQQEEQPSDITPHTQHLDVGLWQEATGELNLRVETRKM